MTPTPEQAACGQHFGTGRALKINAYAGTGKTSTLKLLSRVTRRRGVYLAFNASIAKEARREFPANVSCSTVHSLAFHAVKHDYSSDKMTGNTSAGYIASKLGLKSRTFEVGKGEWLQLSPRGFGFLINETVKRWMRSGDAGINESHVPLDGKLAGAEGPYRRDLVKSVAIEARRLWDRMIDRRDSMPLTHDGYLKLWALRRPELTADFVLLDEAQDTNGVVLALMQHQPSQVVAVGDRHQQIYEWRGARNAMVELPADATARLTTSFRFGQAIADNATAVLRLLGETVPLRGNPERPGAIGPIETPDAVLCRTNAGLIAGVIKEIEADRRPFVVGGVREVVTYIEAAEKLMAGQPVEMPLDFFGFANWRDVQAASEQEDGADLRRWVKLFDDYGTTELRQMLESLPEHENGADVVYSTGHKSKGREWPRVRLTDDFLKGIGEGKTEGTRQNAEEHAPELRLYYVAVTRGRDALEIPAALTAKLRTLEASMTAPSEEPAPVPAAPIVVREAPAQPERDPLADEFEAFDLESILPPIDKTTPPAKAKPEPKKYPGRLVKCSCPKCEYQVYTTRKWINVGLPNCPVDGEALVANVTPAA
jgi:hypothetical protein